MNSTEWAKQARPLLRKLKSVFDEAKTNGDLFDLADKCVEERELIALLAESEPVDFDAMLIEGLSRHIEFTISQPGNFPLFAVIDAQRRSNLPTPIRAEIQHFLNAGFGESL